MKKLIFCFSIFLVLIVSSCKKKELKGVDFRTEMVKFVGEISEYAKIKNSEFLIIPQNGESLASESYYLSYADGIGKEDLSYGYDNDGAATSSGDKSDMVKYLDMFTAENKFVLVTDYVFSNSEDVPDYNDAKQRIDAAYTYCESKAYIPYASVRNLNYLTINPGHEPVEDSISDISDIKSFLYYLQPPDNISKENYLNSISSTNFDLVIMDMTYDGIDEFTSEQILQIKNGLNDGNGGFVVAYMSIGEAEDYRYYWKDEWVKNNGKPSSKAPDWLYEENPDWEGNYKVYYWKQEWKNMIFGTSNAYLDKIIAKGFDGIYLDIIDAFEYYEDIMGE